MKEIQFLIYSTPKEDVKIEAVVKDETLWLTQKAMAELFGVKVPAISKHLKNIFEEGELEESVVISKMEITTQHGAIKDKTQQNETQFYNLDAIISVGYRVNSAKATHFRIWATKVLKEFADSVNEFLAFRRYDILKDKGRISRIQAENKAEAEYDEFNKSQKIISDFDMEIKNITKKIES
ncbi:MAG: virulence RhuM family protein [Bacteroidales bacterium]|nr:virulence RhuM family protein [Bacteroidales bacterium]